MPSGKAIPERWRACSGIAASRQVLGGMSTALLVLVFSTALLGETESEREPRSDIHLRRLLARARARDGAVRRRLARLNPWRAIADAAVVLELVRRRLEPLGELPERVGRWPAAVLLFCFAALELAYMDPASPRALASRSRSTAT